MNRLEVRRISCPHCGEPIEILVDGSALSQDYIEDCSVCCRPISFTVTIEEDKIFLQVFQENE